MIIDDKLNKLLQASPQITEPYDVFMSYFDDYYKAISHRLSGNGVMKIEAIEASMCANESLKNNIAARLAIKLLKSSLYLKIHSHKTKIRIDVIYPVYKEINRMSPRTQKNPWGEDALVKKIEIFKKIERDNPNICINLWIIDDACPDGSGDFAQLILQKNYPNDLGIKYQVLYLRDAIEQNLYPLKNSPKGSIKGAAVNLGMHKILKSYKSSNIGEDCFILDNDADLSIHPGLVGLLLHELYVQNAVAVIGSRRSEDAVALIKPSRDHRGKLYIAIMQNLIPCLLEAQIFDTNRAFKFYTPEAARYISTNQTMFQFPYQIESIILLVNRFPKKVIPHGIVYIDSYPLSTATSKVSYYQHILDQVALSDRFYGKDKCKKLKKLLLDIKQSGWREIESKIPAIIIDTPISKLHELDIYNILKK